LTPDELDAAAPEKSRTIDIEGFVDLADIDPIYYRTTYFLAPEGDAARRAYALLRKAMQESNKVGIATFVMRNKEYLVAIRPEDEVIALETMYFADEIRTPSEELPNLSTDGKFTAKELDMAQLLIDSLAQDSIRPSYHDDYRRQVEELVETQAPGRRDRDRTSPGALEQRRRPARSAPSERRGRRAAPGVGPDQARSRCETGLQAVHAASKAPARSSAKRDRVGAVPATVAKKSTARKRRARRPPPGAPPAQGVLSRHGRGLSAVARARRGWDARPVPRSASHLFAP